MKPPGGGTYHREDRVTRPGGHRRQGGWSWEKAEESGSDWGVELAPEGTVTLRQYPQKCCG